MTRVLWYQMATADAGAGPADKLIEALDYILASKLCDGVILSFTRPVYRAWEKPLAAALISRLFSASVPYYAELWLWPEVVAPDDPYKPETYHAALHQLDQLRQQLPGCKGTVIDTEAYGSNYEAVLNADAARVAAAIRTVLDTDGPLSAPPADILYPGRCMSGPGQAYAMYESLGFCRITEDSYYINSNPPQPWWPPTQHDGRGYFVWPTHSGRFWTPEMLFTHTPWKWGPNGGVKTAMLYGGGHPWLAAQAVMNYGAARAIAPRLDRIGLTDI